jgi:hypothetical protein
VSRALLVVVLAGVMLPRAAFAESRESCEDAKALRAALERESTRVDRYVLAWRIVYTTLAVGELGIAASGKADHDTTVAQWVGGAKSSLAALGFWFAPLRVRVPRLSGDACADRGPLRGIAERAADDERDAFLTAHIAGLVFNAGGALIVAEQTSWQNGLLSFGTGVAVGLISAYTQPRAIWSRVREPSWIVNVAVADGRTSLLVSGSF